MVEIPELTEKQKEEAKEWRIIKCGSPRHKDLFTEFGKQVKKLKVGETMSVKRNQELWRWFDGS